ncbi:MAG: VanZ family protein [Phycisphaerae bacterium]
MTAPAPGRRLSRWDDWYRRTLPAYWAFLFAVTHFPALRLGDVPGSAYLAHVCAYGLLAFLLWRFGETFWRPLPPWYLWFAGITIAAYGAIDEWSQAWFGRGTDFVDWLCDLFGMGTVLALLTWRQRRAASTPASPKPADSPRNPR